MPTVEQLKSDGRNTYWLHSKDVTADQNDLEINLTGNTIIFTKLPTNVTIKFNEKENYGIAVEAKKKLFHPFYRIYISWSATSTPEKLEFILGQDIDISDVNIMQSNKDLVAFSTPLGISITPYTSSSMAIFEYSKITYNVESDVDGTLQIQFSADSVNWGVMDTIAITGGIAKGDVLEVTNRYVRAVFTKLTPSDNQLIFRLSLRARVN